MDHPPGANRAAWQLQIAVRPEARGWRPGRPPADERPCQRAWKVSPYSLHFPKRSDLLDLSVFELDRRGAAEDRDLHIEAGPCVVDFLAGPVERGEGAIRDADLLADLEADGGLGMIDSLGHLALDALGLAIRD